MDYLSIPRNNNKIKYKKSKDYIKDKSVFNNYMILSNKIKKKPPMLRKLIYNFPTHIIVNLLDDDIGNLEVINDCNNIYYRQYNGTKLYKNRILYKYKNKKKKFNNIISTQQSGEIYDKLKILNKQHVEIFLLNYNILKFCALYNILDLGGNYIFNITNYCDNKSIDLLYLVLILFKNMTIFCGRYILCENFDPLIDKKQLIKLINRSYTIEPKNKLLELEKYLIKSFKYTSLIFSYFIKKQYNKIDCIYYDEYLQYIHKISPTLNNPAKLSTIIIDFKIFYLSDARKIYSNKSKKLIKIKAGIGKKEAKYLQKTLKPKNMKKCLEIGLAMGVSTLNIISAIYKHGGTLVSIDPNQSGKWDNIGKQLIENAGLGKYHTIIEDKSYNAMPRLLEKEAGTYDFIFIDGWHTFDYTLIDFFYADKLLKVEGIIVVDDALHRGVKKTIEYVDTNYNEFYKKLDSPNTFGAYKKIKEDPRDWAYHMNF